MSEPGSAEVPASPPRRRPHPGAVLVLIAGALLIAGAFFDLCTVNPVADGGTKDLIHISAWSITLGDTSFPTPRYFGWPLLAVGAVAIVAAAASMFRRATERTAVLGGGMVAAAVAFMVAHVYSEIALFTGQPMGSTPPQIGTSIGAGTELLIGAGVVAIVALVILFRKRPEPPDSVPVAEPDVVIHELPPDEYPGRPG
ncbi:hypothetical protein [Amycolatopsis sp. NBC_01480]|uniref:hypothetical protein n=1 Tax=Amycolatopsis sp. NBC_01480 TaxID=2903562 RepID=UPI002E2E7FB8|nr:hypothetical protein [Amycolatopsis sp. NBC_01480]